jgi:hypothetical protein
MSTGASQVYERWRYGSASALRQHLCKGGHGRGNTGTYIGTVTGEIEMRQRRALRKLRQNSSLAVKSCVRVRCRLSFVSAGRCRNVHNAAASRNVPPSKTISGSSIVKLHLFVFHNTDTFYLPPSFRFIRYNKRTSIVKMVCWQQFCSRFRSMSSSSFPAKDFHSVIFT